MTDVRIRPADGGDREFILGLVPELLAFGPPAGLLLGEPAAGALDAGAPATTLGAAFPPLSAAGPVPGGAVCSGLAVPFGSLLQPTAANASALKPPFSVSRRATR